MRPHIVLEHGLRLMELAGFFFFYFPHNPPTIISIPAHTQRNKRGGWGGDRAKERKRQENEREDIRGGK